MMRIKASSLMTCSKFSFAANRHLYIQKYMRMQMIQVPQTRSKKKIYVSSKLPMDSYWGNSHVDSRRYMEEMFSGVLDFQCSLFYVQYTRLYFCLLTKSNG